MSKQGWISRLNARTQILSFPCSFLEILAKSSVGANPPPPREGWHPDPGNILDLPLVCALLICQYFSLYILLAIIENRCECSSSRFQTSRMMGCHFFCILAGNGQARTNLNLLLFKVIHSKIHVHTTFAPIL